MKTPHAILIGLSLIAATIWSPSAVAQEITLLCVESHSRHPAGNRKSWRWVLDKEKNKLWTVKSFKSGQGEKSAEFTLIQDDPKTKNMWFHRVDKFSNVIAVAIRNDGLLQQWGVSAHNNYRNGQLTPRGNATSYDSYFRCNQKNLW